MCMLEMYMQGNYVKQMMDICLVMTVIILNLMVLVRYRLQCRFTNRHILRKHYFSFLPGTASIPNIDNATLTLSILTVSFPCSNSRTNLNPNPERIANSS